MLLCRRLTFNKVGVPTRRRVDVPEEDRQLDRTKFLGVAATGVAAAGTFGFAGLQAEDEAPDSSGDQGHEAVPDRLPVPAALLLRR